MNPGQVNAIHDPIRIVTWGPYTHKLPAWRLEDPIFWIVLVMIFVMFMLDRIVLNVLQQKWRQEG